MFKRFFRFLINATEPTTSAALRRPATAKRNARGEKARERYIKIAAALKAEAGITQHTEQQLSLLESLIAEWSSRATTGRQR